MKVMSVTAVILALVAAPALGGSWSKPTAQLDHDGETTVVARTPFGVGEVSVADPRILDLSGEYGLSDGSLTVTLSLIQDARGRLAGSYSVSEGSTSVGPYPVVGSLAVERSQPLRFEVRGRSGNGGNRVEMRARGIFDGTEFTTALRLKSNGSTYQTTTTLVPALAERGALLSDGQAYLLKNGSTLISTRTLSLPWGTLDLPAIERTFLNGTQFAAGGTVPRKGVFGRPEKTGLKLMARTGATGELEVYLNHVRLGYGHLESAEYTTVTKSALAPISANLGTIFGFGGYNHSHGAGEDELDNGYEFEEDGNELN